MTRHTPFQSRYFFFNHAATTDIYTLSLHDALPISLRGLPVRAAVLDGELIALRPAGRPHPFQVTRSEEHTSELQSQSNLVCRLLLEKKKHGLCARMSTAVRAPTRPAVTCLCKVFMR